jgi:quercetin dioxygenase-like cupin family protein
LAFIAAKFGELTGIVIVTTRKGMTTEIDLCRVMTERNAQMLNSGILDLFGPTIQPVIPLSDGNGGYCLLKGTVPPGIIVPIHSHPDRETFYVLGGQIQAPSGDSWQTLEANGVFDVPGDTKHVFRNVSNKNASILTVTTTALARFLLKAGRPVASVPPGPP